MATIEHIYMPKNHMDTLYNSKNPLVRFVHRGRLHAIASNLPSSQNLSILDAGCGEGHLIEKLHTFSQKNSYYGVDITKVAIEKAKKRCPYAILKIGDLSKIPYPDSFFDVVICSEVLEHIPEYETIISELKRVLKKGGFLIISFPNEKLWTLSRLFLGRRPIKVPDHVNSFTPRIIRNAVEIRVVKKQMLPFDLPFFISLICILVFKK